MPKGPPLAPRVSSFTLRGAQRLAAKLPAKWDRRVRELGKVLIDYRGARSTALRAPLYSLLGRFSPLLAARHGRATMIVDATDGEVGRTVFVRGDYERCYMEEALRFLTSYSPDRKPGPVFVDVGANIGTSTLDALLEFGFERAICFEPDSRNYRLLRLNIVLNELEPRVRTFRQALSDREGEALLRRASGNFGDSRVMLSGESSLAETERIEVRTLDALMEEGVVEAKSIGMLWIDAQGHDPQVLAGARRALEAGFPVVAEYWPHGLGEAGLELMEAVVPELFSSFVDLRRLRDGSGGLRDAGEIRSLREEHLGNEFTDLLLLR